MKERDDEIEIARGRERMAHEHFLRVVGDEDGGSWQRCQANCG